MSYIGRNNVGYTIVAEAILNSNGHEEWTTERYAVVLGVNDDDSAKMVCWTARTYEDGGVGYFHGHYTPDNAIAAFKNRIENEIPKMLSRAQMWIGEEE